MLIGNKADLEDQREVQIIEAKHFKEENKIHFFCETSAKNGLNAKEIFFEAAKLLYDDHLKYKARANKNSGLKLIQKINDSNDQLKEENEENKEEEGKKEEEEKEEEEKEEEEKEEGEEKNEAKISDNIIEKKCSIEEHSNIISNSFCQKCEIFMCNKCEEYHSHLFKNLHLIKLNENKDEDIFIGICKEKNHSMKLEYYCQDHNILCCSSCLCCIKSNGNGKHKDCNTCSIKKIKNKKKNELSENISYLENLSKTIEESINELKKLYETISESKEKLKKK